MSSVRLILFAAAAVGCSQPPAPAIPPCPSVTIPPPIEVKPTVIKATTAKFVTRDEAPDTSYTIHGKLEVTLGTDLVVVRDISKGETTAFPTRRLLYAGDADFN